MARGDHLRNMSQEERERVLAMARQTKLDKAAARVGNPLGLKLSYADEGHWDDLARKHGIKRMPSKEDQVDTAVVRKFMHKLDISNEVFQEHFTSVKYFVEKNPKWTKYAAAGVLLELKESLA